MMYGVLPAFATIGRRIGEGIKFVLPIVVVLLMWEAAVRLGLANATILPPPSAIGLRAAQMLTNPPAVLLAGIGTSLFRALTAFALAVVVAIPAGFALGLSRTAYDWVSPVLSIMLPIPAVAWTPIFLVIFGQGDVTIIWVCFLGAVFPILYGTIQGVRSISHQSVWVVKSMGASPAGVFFRVLLPASLPTLMAGLKLGMAHSWRTLVAAEFLAALNAGLGYMIFAARAYMDVTTMFVGIVCLAIIGMIIEYFVFGVLEHVTIERWYHGGDRIGGSA